MRKEAEAHAEEDRRRKELIEARNYADNAVYTAEKVLRDLGDKVPGDLKSQVEDQVAKVRQVDEQRKTRRASAGRPKRSARWSRKWARPPTSRAAPAGETPGPEAAGPGPEQGPAA